MMMMLTSSLLCQKSATNLSGVGRGIGFTAKSFEKLDKKYEEQILLNLGYDEKIKDIILARNRLFRRLDHCVETKGSDYISWHGTYQVKMRMMTEED